MILVRVNLLFTDSNSLLQPEKQKQQQQQQQQQQKKTERLLRVGLPQFQLHYKILCSQVLWIEVNLQQCKCKYRKPQFNSSLLAVVTATTTTLVIELWLATLAIALLQVHCNPQYHSNCSKHARLLYRRHHFY